MANGDVAGARTLMHDDFKFSGPLDQFSSPEPYLQALGRLAPIVERVDVLKRISEGDEVAQFCNFQFKPPIGPMFVAEWYHVKGDKIAELRIAFDARPMAAMMPK